MFGLSKILVCVALVFATTVSSDERSRRSDLIDLGTSILLPWESASNARLRNTIYNRAPSTDILRVKNIGGQDLNERNELQQALRNLGRLSNEYGNRQQYLARGASNLDLSQNSQRNGLVQKGLRQNGYAGLGSYSTFTNNQEEEQALIEKIRQRQAQNLDQSRINELTEQNLRKNIAQRNAQLSEAASLGSQSYGINVESASQAADIINANRWGKYNQLANSGILAGLGQQRTSGYSQVNQLNRDLNQQGWRNTGRLVALNKLGQNNAQSYGALNEQELLRSSQESVDSEVQQNNYNAERIRALQLRALNNRHLYRPIAVNQGAASENANIEQQQNAELNVQEPATQVLEIRPEQLSQNNLGSNSGVLVNSYQPQDQALQAGLNQQQQNVYTYGELNAKIWKVIKSNPAMMSNLDNLREQLLSGRDSGIDQMRQLKGLLQQARQYNRNVLIPANSEEQERNAVVANLIDAMNTNELISSPVDVRGHLGYGGWRA